MKNLPSIKTMSRRERAFYTIMLIDFAFGMVGCFHPHVSFADISSFVITINTAASVYIGADTFRKSDAPPPPEENKTPPDK